MVKVSDILNDLGITYKLIGENYIVGCWFHPETHPSMSIHKDNGVYHCFSCGNSGNLFNIIKDHLNLTGIDALKYLAEFSNVRENDDKERVRIFEEEVLAPRAKNKLLDRYIIEMPNYTLLRFHPYLAQRGITAGEIIQWKMGQVDYKQLKPDFFGYIGWIIIPIYQDGILRNYFMRSPFTKSKVYGKYSIKNVLFGYDTAKDFSKPVYVVEGIFDMIMLRRMGVQVVASLTNRLYDEQRKLLKQYSKIIIVPDNDEPGFRLVFDALLLANSSSVVVCKVPDGKKDTADCTLKELEQIINCEFDIVEYITEMQYVSKFGKTDRE